MAAHVSTRRVVYALAALLAASSLAFAQSAAPPAVPAAPQAKADTAAKPAPPPSPIQGMRNKISAGDLLSAESILEVYREKNGEDARYCPGLAWLARGAMLLGDQEKARRYASDVRGRCADSIAGGARLDQNDDLAVALGAAIEVDAQLLERERGAQAAAAMLSAELDRLEGPVSLRSRVNKRLNLISLAGRRAPELEVDDWLGAKPPTLASLRGKPVVLFLWAEWCGDCRAQAASLARIKSRHAADGLQILALSRYYEKAVDKRAAEKARVDSVWKADYTGIGTIPMVMSTASMERYGASSTPTFVFVDRAGVVRDYTPTRLTEAELERRITSILK
jgi:thiol-disulfide isomerase/thioredoxin